MPRDVVKIHLQVSSARKERVAICGLQNVNMSFTHYTHRVTCERCIRKLEQQRRGEMGVVR